MFNQKRSSSVEYYALGGSESLTSGHNQTVWTGHLIVRDTIQGTGYDFDLIKENQMFNF